MLVLVWVSFLHSDCGLDAPGLVPFGFFLDILLCSSICSHCANILSQFTAPCDALRTWPFCFPTCWSHFINGVLFLRISAPDLSILTSPRDWFGRGPARFQLPYRSPRHGSVAPSQPLNRYAYSSFVRAGSGCCVSDGLSSISLLRLHSSFAFILWVASCHACFDIPFLCPE